MDQKVEKKDGQRLERKRWQRTEQGGEEMEERKGCSKLVNEYMPSPRH